MNKFLFGCFGLLLGFLAHAQTSAGMPLPSTSMAAVSATSDAREAERARLSQKRRQIEEQERQGNLACLQKFDVNGCKKDVREQRIQADRVLRKDELRFNQQERQIKADQARQRRADKEGQAEDRAADALRAQKDSQARQQNHATQQADHATQGQNRAQYDQKQRDAAEHRRSIEVHIRDRDKPRAAPLPLPGGSAQ